MKTLTREEYLNEAKKELAKIFKQNANIKIHKKIKISCGFPISNNRPSSKSSYRVGECWKVESSTNNFNEIFINPTIADSIEAIGILAHELIHATDNGESGHKNYFRKTALAIGLTGKMTATTIGDDLRLKIEGIVAKLGKYPHSALDISKRKKQTTRLIKIECIVCAAKFRTARSTLDNATVNISEANCIACGRSGTLESEYTPIGH